LHHPVRNPDILLANGGSQSATIRGTEWTPLQIALAVWQKTRPVAGGHFEESLIGIAVIYAMMVAGLAVIFIRGSRHYLRIIATIGLVPSCLAKFWEHDFLFTFGWQYFGSEHMQRGVTW